jgi:hypothetical protein
MGPECQSLGPTAPRPRRPLLDNDGHHLALAHGLAAAVFPPTISPPPSSTASGSYKGRPPPPWSTLSSSSAFHPPLRRCSRCRWAAVDSPLRPLSDRFDHAPSTAPSCTTSPHPELSTTTSGRPHLTVELVLSVSFSFLPPQNGSTTLPPCSPDPPHYTSSLGAAGIRSGRHQRRRSRAPPLPRRDGPPAQVAGPLGRAGRALLWAEPKCTVHFLNYLSISFELIQINSEFD